MPVFLRWLLIEMIVKRVLQHPRVRGQVNRMVPLMSQRYPRRFGGRLQNRFGGRGFGRRQRRLGCASGCLGLLLAMVLGLTLLVAVVHWLL